MNSLPGRAALSLCRRTAAGGMRVFIGAQGHPTGGMPADKACFQAVRVCHSGTGRKSVSTKKRGYDITRNPHLNKVSLLIGQVSLPLTHLEAGAHAEYCMKHYHFYLLYNVWCMLFLLDPNPFWNLFFLCHGSCTLLSNKCFHTQQTVPHAAHGGWLNLSWRHEYLICHLCEIGTPSLEL